MKFSRIKPAYNAINNTVDIMIRNASSMVYRDSLDVFLEGMVNIKGYLHYIEDEFMKEGKL